MNKNNITRRDQWTTSFSNLGDIRYSRRTYQHTYIRMLKLIMGVTYKRIHIQIYIFIHTFLFFSVIKEIDIS